MSTKLGKAKSRLGRGLSSLISVSELPVEAEIPSSPAMEGSPTPSIVPAISHSAPAAFPSGLGVEIDVASITPNPHQPRKQINDQSIAELAATLKSTGLIQPIIVRRDGNGYQLIAGERRLRAAKLAGLTTLPAIVRDIDAFTQAQMALVENIQREDLNPIDRAQAYRGLIQQLGLTQSELASRMGEDRSSVANFMRLLDLAEPVKAMIRDGRLSLGHAKLLAGVPDILEQERLANLVLSQGLSVRNLERLLQQGPSTDAPAPRAASASSPHLQDLEKSLARQLGMRVQLRAGAKKGRGKLIVHYSSLDQFDGLLQRLGVTPE
jgi:ParB family transcriptional regulator, chromosome partitioning protein